MRSSSPSCVAVFVSLLLIGCAAEPAANPGAADDSKRAEPAPTKPEVDTALPPEPPPELVEPTEPPPPEPASRDPDEGFAPGPKPEPYTDDALVEGKPLRHAGAIVSAQPVLLPPLEPEGDPSLFIAVHVEFEGAEHGLNHRRAVAGRFCDELVPEVQEIAKLDDGRWLVDAQLACRMGEDYFSADNAHTLVVVDPRQRKAALLWTGADTGANAMGVCVSSSVSSFEVRGDELIVFRDEVTQLDRKAAKELPAAAEGCVARPETTTEVARISLAPDR